MNLSEFGDQSGFVEIEARALTPSRLAIDRIDARLVIAILSEAARPRAEDYLQYVSDFSNRS